MDTCCLDLTENSIYTIMHCERKDATQWGDPSDAIAILHSITRTRESEDVVTKNGRCSSIRVTHNASMASCSPDLEPIQQQWR